jgi:methenyltetrahydromethanopterin cyclohydrolase
MLSLNELALRRCELLAEHLAERMHMHAGVLRMDCGARVIDCGVQASGGLEVGRQLAEICLADLGRVSFVPGSADVWSGPAVAVHTDQPVAACMASQYAGWQIAGEKFFAMGSGPMRAAAGKEKIYDHIGYRETAAHAVGVLESGKLPPDDVCRKIAADCKIEPANLTLLVARTASIAGSVQVVARTVETALHKMHELGFDLSRVQSGFGVAPLPPIAKNDLAGIGRTNDAVLYGGEVTLWIRGDDESLATLGPQIPASASRDYGEPFAAIFERAGKDFYKIDPLLFSPGVVNLVNLDSGTFHRFGQLRPDVLKKSFTSSM